MTAPTPAVGIVSPEEARRVLFVSHSSGFQGAEQVLLELVERLDRRNWTPVLLLPSAHGELHRRLVDLGVALEILRTPTWMATRPVRSRWWRAEIDAARAVARLIARERIDIVYTNTAVKLCGAVAAALSGRAHVWHVHELFAGYPLKSPLSLPSTLRLIATLSDRVIAISRAVADQFPRGVRARRVALIPNGVDPNSFASSERSALVIRAELPPGAPVVGVFGKVCPMKNQMLAVRAFAAVLRRIPAAQLVIAGEEDRDYRIELDHLVASLGMAGSVRFLGFRDDVRSLFREIDVLVVPSVAEPFGRVTIEAMAAGKPVVATATGATPEIVEAGETGHLVPLGDAEAMASALLELLQNPAEARRMGAAGKERVAREFHIDDTVRKVTEALRSACGKPPRIRTWVVRAICDGTVSLAAARDRFRSLAARRTKQ